ncbi:putative reverse transcriptase domain-containing protein [Tanacetum coccineum]
MVTTRRNSDDDVPNFEAMITCNLYIDDRTVFVLFDTGATHSIISTTFAKNLNMNPTPLIERVIISTPMKNHMLIDHEYVNCPLRFADRIRPANLLPIHMLDFDVILGMDWLASHRATIDCYARTVIFGNVRQPEFVYHGSSPLKSVKLISAMKARTLISHGCQGFLASVMDTSLERSSGIDIFHQEKGARLSYGFNFNWIKSLKNVVNSILKELDRVMVSDEFPSSHAVFQPFLVSDHSPALPMIPTCWQKKSKSFRFANYIADKLDFINNVIEGWKVQVEGYHMYSLPVLTSRAFNELLELEFVYLESSLKIIELESSSNKKLCSISFTSRAFKSNT